MQSLAMCTDPTVTTSNEVAQCSSENHGELRCTEQLLSQHRWRHWSQENLRDIHRHITRQWQSQHELSSWLFPMVVPSGRFWRMDISLITSFLLDSEPGLLTFCPGSFQKQFEEVVCIYHALDLYIFVPDLSLNLSLTYIYLNIAISLFLNFIQNLYSESNLGLTRMLSVVHVLVQFFSTGTLHTNPLQGGSAEG